MRKKLLAAALSLLTGPAATWAQGVRILDTPVQALPTLRFQEIGSPEPVSSQVPLRTQDVPVAPRPVIRFQEIAPPEAVAPYTGPVSFTHCPTGLPRIWGSSEYLLWWVKNQSLIAPLATTTSNPNLTDANGFNVAAGLGRAGTSVLLGPGGPPINYGALSGGRVTVGGWLDSAGTLGLEGRGFLMQNGSFHRTFSSKPDGTNVVALPFFDIAGVIGGGQNAVAESFPGTFRGDDTIISHTQLWGAEANGLFNVYRSQKLTIDLIGGFRYADLKEDLSIIGRSTNLLGVNAVPVAGGVGFLNNFFDGTVSSTDIFKARNQFYGSQVGARAEGVFGKIFVNMTGKVALGSNHQSTDIQGFSTLQVATMNAITPGGTYALPSNIGQRTHNAFSVIPEFEFKVGYNFTQQVRGFVGYNFMYWSNVARPGELINHNVDIRQVPTLPTFDPTVRAVQPGPLSGNTGFWAQGINFGLEFRF